MTLIWAINRITGWVVDGLLCWFERPWPALAAAAFGLTALLLLIFRWSSRPAEIARARNRLTARVLELVLFRHDALVSFTAGGRILAANAGYLRTLVWPLACTVLPCLLVLTQLAGWFAWRPFRTGEAALVEVRLRDDFAVLEHAVSLELPGNARLDSSGVRIPSLAEVDWRIRAESAGSNSIAVRTDSGPPVVKQLVVGDTLQKVSPRRTAPHWCDSWLYPAEPPIDNCDSIKSIAIRYPSRKWYVGNREVDWIFALVVFSVLFGLIMKRPLGVQL